MQSAQPLAGAYRAIGLLTNPFAEPDDGSSDPLGTKLATFNASNGVLAAIERSVRSDRRPIIVEKSADVPEAYHVAAIADALGRMADGELPGVLQVYVPIDMMRIGRTRAVLGVTAERLAYTAPGLTIAAWAAEVFADPDESLTEWEPLSRDEDALALASSLDTDPQAFADAVFGETVQAREGADDFEMMMRISTARQQALEADPAEPNAEVAQAAADEIADEGALAEAFVTPLGDVSDTELAEHTGPTAADLVAEYLIAHAAAHLSPVLARGLRAFRAQGMASMAEELKVTKAPTKTLSALARFACHRFDAMAVILDRFDLFEVADEQLKTKIATTLFQLRWQLKDHAAFVLLLPPGLAPQVEESFGTAERVTWDLRDLEAVGTEGSAFDVAVASRWLAGASLGDTNAWAAELLAAAPTDVPADQAFRALADALDHAAAQGRPPVVDDFITALERLGTAEVSAG